MRQFFSILCYSFFSYFLWGVSSPSSARFCLVDSKGEVASGCTGPKLVPAELDTFKVMYPDSLQTKPPVTLNPLAPLLNPLLEQDTSHMSNQMILGTRMKNLKMKTMTNIFNWDRFRVITAFGGSVSEGQVLLPSRNWIYQAHRQVDTNGNRIEIMGTIFFPPDAYGGQNLDSQVEWLLDPSSDVIQNLIDAARLYGIDGYFINGESGFSQSHKPQFEIFISTLRARSASQGYPLRVEWYVVGSVDPGMILDAKSEKVTDAVFVDHFIWSSFATQFNKLTPEQRAKYNAMDIEYGAYNVSELDSLLGSFAKDQGASLGFFNFNAVGSPQGELMTNEAKILGNMRAFWMNHDQYFPARSMTFNLPFSTWFNLGMGKKFFVGGALVANDHWNCIGLQSYLPRFEGQNLPDLVDYDFDRSYQGGSSLRFNLQSRRYRKHKKTLKAKIADKLTCKNSVKLTKTVTLFNNMNMTVKGKALTVTVTFAYPNLAKLPKSSDAPQICLNGSLCYPLTASKRRNLSVNDGTWYHIKVPLNQSGSLTTINSIALNYSESSSPLVLNIGGIHIEEAQFMPVAKVLQVPATIAGTLGDGHVYSWKETPGAMAYDIYLNGVFLAETVHNSYWLENIPSTDLKVIPVYGGIAP